MAIFAWDLIRPIPYIFPVGNADGFTNPGQLRGSDTSRVVGSERGFPAVARYSSSVGNDTRYRVYSFYSGYPNLRDLGRSAARIWRISPNM